MINIIISSSINFVANMISFFIWLNKIPSIYTLLFMYRNMGNFRGHFSEGNVLMSPLTAVGL